MALLFRRAFITKGESFSGSVAQLVERTTENREVTGSTPVGATSKAPENSGAFSCALNTTSMGITNVTYGDKYKLWWRAQRPRLETEDRTWQQNLL